MKEYLRFNLNSHLYKNSKKYSITWFIPLIIIIFIIIFSLTHSVYNVYDVSAIYKCDQKCTLDFYISILDGFTYDYITINNKTYEIDNILYGDIELNENNVGIQKIALEVKEYEGKNNEVVKLKIFKNKEKMLKKIYEIIKER